MSSRSLPSSFAALTRLDRLAARLASGDNTASPQDLQFFDRHHPAPAELLIQVVAAARQYETEAGWEGPICTEPGRDVLLDDAEEWLRRWQGISNAVNRTEEQRLLDRFPPDLLRSNRRNVHNVGLTTRDKTLAVAYFAVAVPDHPKWAIEWFVCDTVRRPGVKMFGDESARRIGMLLHPWQAMLDRHSTAGSRRAPG